MPCSFPAKPDIPRPNIIYIMSDDHAVRAVSAYGSDIAHLTPTPNIDRIARNGVRLHGFDKRFMYEESFRAPLLMQYPARIQPGTW